MAGGKKYPPHDQVVKKCLCAQNYVRLRAWKSKKSRQDFWVKIVSCMIVVSPIREVVLQGHSWFRFYRGGDLEDHCLWNTTISTDCQDRPPRKRSRKNDPTPRPYIYVLKKDYIFTPFGTTFWTVKIAQVMPSIK